MQFDRLGLTNYGWVVDDGNVLPLWYDGPQLPPSVNKGKERKKAESNKARGYWR